MIEFSTGEVTTAGQGSLAINAFYKKDRAYREQPIHLAEADVNSGIPKTEKIIEIIPSGNPKLKKNWTTRRHNLPSGSYLKFIIRKSKAGGGVWSSSMASIMLRCRDGAPLQRIEIDLPFSPGCTKSRLYIEGRFDILDSEKVAELGLDKNASGTSEIVQFETGDEIFDDYAHVIVLEKAITAAAKAKTTTIAGTNKVLTRIRRQRRVGLRE